MDWGRHSLNMRPHAQSLAGTTTVWPGFHSVWPFLGFAQAWAREAEERRLFLWLPVAAGAGALLYLHADTEPVVWLPIVLFSLTVAGAAVLRARPAAFMTLSLVAALLFGFLCGELRRWRIDAPVLDRPHILSLSGIVEEVDMQPHGARFILRVVQAADTAGHPLTADMCPQRVRLSAREGVHLAAGDTIRILARLLPPARASLPGGYDFSRTAYFSGLGAVGSVLGRVEALTQADLTLSDRIEFAFDRSRNRLADRVNTIIGGEEGAIAAAMVTGKRMLLTEDALDVIRQAGIFHIITISGVQMTLVAGMMFWISRRILAFSTDLALRYPIKKIAACIAIAGALIYDFGTGSRVGTERALFMTMIMLGAILFDRQALTMRNLGFAVLAVVVLEPEAIAGASFQLSFAAVAALIALQEARYRAVARKSPQDRPARPVASEGFSVLTHLAHWAEGGRTLFVSTCCATMATASFMAANFHDLSPYVLIGNPLTLAVIEFFAVPGALIGALLYPLGLDSLVWTYVGAGIRLVLWAARLIGSAPGATVHVHDFAPWALPFLTLAVLNMVIWRSWALRALAVPCALIGLAGAYIGAPFDIVIPPTGDSLALRQPDGRLAVIGRHPSVFAATQWLAADGDGRNLGQATSPTQLCDATACVQQGQGSPKVSVVNDMRAFEEDCLRADIIVSNLQAPSGCKARWVFDSVRLASLGAVTLTYAGPSSSLQSLLFPSALPDLIMKSERSSLTDRPWSRSPDMRERRATRTRIEAKSSEQNSTISPDGNAGSLVVPAKMPVAHSDSVLGAASDDNLPFADDDLQQ